MPTIIALNPRGKGKKKKRKKKQKKRKMSALQLKYFGSKAQRKNSKKKRGKKKMAKKKRKMTALQKKYFGTKAQRKGSTAMAKKKTRKRSNPKKKKSTRRRFSAGVNLMGAAKSTVPLLFGALVAKFAAKKFAEGGSETENWNWKNYAFAGVGTFAAAYFVSAVLKKRAPAQKVLEGGLLILAYKLFTNEIAPMNSYTESWFAGAEDEFNPYNGLDAGEPGDLWASDSGDYVKGIDGYWRPASESHRIPQGNRSMGDVMVPPDARYGDVMVPPSARYGTAEIDEMIENDQM